MKQLLLDHLRRWSWLLAASAALAFVLGWCMAAPADYFAYGRHRETLGPAFLFFKVQSNLIESSTLTLALLTGAFLLLFDWQHGLVRALAPLPLTGNQIGRSWWLATVAIPSIALPALLFLGAATFYCFCQKTPLPTERLAIASLFALLWPGMMFTGILGSRPGFFGNGPGRAWVGFFSLSETVLIFYGLSLFQQELKHPVKFAVFLGAGAGLTALGWYRAGQFDPGGAQQSVLRRVAPPNPSGADFRLTPLNPKISSSRHPVSGGFGGTSFLVSTTFARSFLYIVAMIAIMALLTQWHSQVLSPNQNVTVFAETGSFLFCGFIMVFQFLPVLRQLRFLRTLPISATRLAAVMLGVVILPLIALGTLAASIAWWLSGIGAARSFLNSYTMVLVPASVCVFIALWRSERMLTYVLLVFTLFGSQWIYDWLKMFLHKPEIPIGWIGLTAATCVGLSWLLTRRVLLQSNDAYRVRANLFGNFPWGMGGDLK
jgi:hypothetical protein